jgi:hypothetical protein
VGIDRAEAVWHLPDAAGIRLAFPQQSRCSASARLIRRCSEPYRCLLAGTGSSQTRCWRGLDSNF